MSKYYESRMNALEQRLIPQKPERSIIYVTIGSNVFRIDGKDYTKSGEKTDEEFLNELEARNIICSKRVVAYMREISLEE